MRPAALAAAAFAALLSAAPAQITTIDSTFNYQGRLRDANGPVDGTVTLTFRVYNLREGGDPVHTHTAENVPVSKGLLSVDVPIPFGGFDVTQRYLGVQVGDGPEMTPRTRLTATPYSSFAISAQTAGNATNADTAANAQTLDGKDSLDFAAADHGHSSLLVPFTLDSGVIVNASGNVGIGGAPQEDKLEVLSSGPNRLRIETTQEGGQALTMYKTPATQWFAGITAGTNEFRLVDGSGTLRLRLGSDGVLTVGDSTNGGEVAVHGDVRLGDNASLIAPGAEEALRIVRGSVSFFDFGGDNTLEPVAGTGYTLRRIGTGYVEVLFTEAFPAGGRPSVTVTSVRNGGNANTELVSATGFRVILFAPVQGGGVAAESHPFEFIAVGPR